MGLRRDTEKKVWRIMMNDLAATGAIGGIRARVSEAGAGGRRWRWMWGTTVGIGMCAPPSPESPFTDNSSQHRPSPFNDSIVHCIALVRHHVEIVSALITRATLRPRKPVPHPNANTLEPPSPATRSVPAVLWLEKSLLPGPPMWTVSTNCSALVIDKKEKILICPPHGRSK